MERENYQKDLQLYVWGFFGEQEKMQQIGQVFLNAGRELYILSEIAPNIANAIDIAGIVHSETGLTWQKIVIGLMFLWLHTGMGKRLSEENIYSQYPEIISKDEILQIAEKYSVSYDDVRNSELGRQIFYTRPYVKTQTKKLQSINCFLNLMIYEHSILWIVRDYFNKLGRRDFTSFFGKCFETYFEELLAFALMDDQYYRIPEEKVERADWKIKLGRFQFLVEQKSTFLRLSIKQQATDIDAIKKFAKDTIFKAMKQLQKTEQDFNNGQYIKVILLYDDYLSPQVFDQFLAMEKCDISNDGYYWLASIEEMELLLSLYKSNPEDAERVILEKLERDAAHSSAYSTTLAGIISDLELYNNSFIEEPRIKRYTDFALDNAMKCMLGEKQNGFGQN